MQKYVAMTLLVLWDQAISFSGAISIIYKFCNCNSQRTKTIKLNHLYLCDNIQTDYI